MGWGTSPQKKRGGGQKSRRLTASKKNKGKTFEKKQRKERATPDDRRWKGGVGVKKSRQTKNTREDWGHTIPDLKKNSNSRVKQRELHKIP